MADSPLEALGALAESLGASANEADLERALPIVTRTLKNALRTDPLPDLGETEPAIGLRYDVGDLRGGAED
ncbi:MAG: hypothetical protein F4Y69_05810 [Chloroflexi bacterium]|nr:hypothetical protein [Chloroflexota bacterium]MYF21964.1 hypothetical protein [Chloroflexota bacterium]